MRYLVTLSIEIDTQNADKAIEGLSEFMQGVRINGKLPEFSIEDVKEIQPEVLQED